MNIKQVWVGLADVVPAKGSKALGESKGAFVNVLGLASSKSQFIELAKEALIKEGFFLVSLEEVELFFERIKSYEVADELHDLANQIKEKGGVGWGKFHTYAKDETMH